MKRLSDWCKENSISTTTAWRLRKAGKFPYPTTKIGVTIFVLENEKFHGFEKVMSCPKCGEDITAELFLR